MALYELSEDQRDVTVELLERASIPGKAAPLVASILRALASPVAVREAEQPEPEAATE
jgi:hypothetical protein